MKTSELAGAILLPVFTNATRGVEGPNQTVFGTVISVTLCC